MYPIDKDTASQKVYVRLFDSTDHVTPETGVAGPTITISKNGGAFAGPNDGTWAELGNGLYTVELDATDTNTAGPLAVRVVKAGCDTAIACVYVREQTEQDVLNAIPPNILTEVVTGGGATVADILTAIYSMARGKIVAAGDVYEFYDDDDATLLFTLTIAANSRTTA